MPVLAFVGLPMIALKAAGWRGPANAVQFAAGGVSVLLFYAVSFKYLFSETERAEIFAALQTLSPRTTVKEAEIYEP